MKKFISLFLVVSILLLSGNLFAKERKGADLIIQRTDGTQVRGELIAVKQNSLLLLGRDTGADVTVDIGDINIITIVKKSGVGLGLVIGGAAGALGGYIGSSVFWQVDIRQTWTLVGGVIGLVSGALIGKAISRPKTIQLEGKSDSEIKEIMEKLRKKARVKNSQ